MFYGATDNTLNDALRGPPEWHSASGPRRETEGDSPPVEDNGEPRGDLVEPRRNLLCF